MAAVAALHPLGVANRAVEAAVAWRCGATSGPWAQPGSTPVLLVHGCGANKSSWIALAAHLRRAGYGHVETMNYTPIGTSVAQIAERLVRRVHAMRQRTGSAKVHLVGHSLGGIIVRYAVSELGLDAHTAAAITIGSPHRGVPLAGIGVVGRRCGVRNAIADIASGSAVLSRLDRHARCSTVRWTAYYSNLDVVVPAHAARLTAQALAATNIEIPDAGHIGLLLDRRLLRSIAIQLRAADTPPRS